MPLGQEILIHSNSGGVRSTSSSSISPHFFQSVKDNSIHHFCIGFSQMFFMDKLIPKIAEFPITIGVAPSRYYL
jgi:hypothetical protein